MIKKHNLCCAVVLVSVVMPVQATVSIGPDLIVRGTTIEVGGPGPNLQEIIDGITDESATKPYLIKLGAGVYTIDDTLSVASFVSIMGSGQGVTILKGAVSTAVTSAASALVQMRNSALTDLSVENTGGSSYSFAILSTGVSPRIERVTATASGGSDGNWGVYFNSSPLPTMTNVVASASGGTNAAGVYMVGSSPIMTNILATGSGGSTSNGVYMSVTGSPFMTNVVATASGGSTNYGVAVFALTSPTMTNVVASASGGSSDYGVITASTAAPRIDSSSLTGATYGMRFLGSTATRISNTQIVGGIDADPDAGAAAQCLNTFDADFAPVDC